MKDIGSSRWSDLSSPSTHFPILLCDGCFLLCLQLQLLLGCDAFIPQERMDEKLPSLKMIRRSINYSARSYSLFFSLPHFISFFTFSFSCSLYSFLLLDGSRHESLKISIIYGIHYTSPLRRGSIRSIATTLRE